MSGIGDLLLKMLGHENPTSGIISGMLASGGAPGGTTVATPGVGVATPSAPGSGPGTAAPAAQPTAYQSPPDLLQLYNQLTDYQSREKRIDSGLGLIGGAVVQPRNTGLVSDMFGGGNSSAEVPLSLFLHLQNFKQSQTQQKLATDKLARDQASVPVIAKQYGISTETAQYLMDSGSLDQFVLNAAKPDTKVVTDPGTGKSVLINSKDGTTIMDLGGTLAPTNDQKEFNDAKAAGTLPQGVTDLPSWLAYTANLKKPVTNVNVDTSSNKFIEGMDTNLTNAVTASQDQQQLIGQLQSARQTLGKGIVAGSVIAPATNEGRKILAQIFGIDDKTASNTDTLMAQLKNVVLPKLKELRPVSDTDLQTVEAIVGGTASLTPQTINQLIDIQEKAARQQIVDTNTKVQKRIDAMSDDPKKQQAQAAFDASKATVPAYDGAYLSHVNPDDIAELKGKPTPENVKEFDQIYGPGAAEQILGTK